MLCSDRWKWRVWATKGISFADHCHIVTRGGIMMDHDGSRSGHLRIRVSSGASGPWVWSLAFQRRPRCHRIRHPGSRDFLCSHGSCSGSRDHGGRTSWVPLPRRPRWRTWTFMERQWNVVKVVNGWSKIYLTRVVTLHKDEKYSSSVVEADGSPYASYVRNSLNFSVIFQAIRKHGYQQPTPIQVQLQMAEDCRGFNFDLTDQNLHCDERRLLSNYLSTASQFPWYNSGTIFRNHW